MEVEVGAGVGCGGWRQGWRQEKWRGRGRREKDVPHSEYGGLVLGADGALGVLGVHQPRGAALRLRVGLQIHWVHLGKGRRTSQHQHIIGKTAVGKIEKKTTLMEENAVQKL